MINNQQMIVRLIRNDQWIVVYRLQKSVHSSRNVKKI